VALAGPAHALSDHQRQFVADVVQHGGVNADGMINGETQKTLGDAVCGDLHKGNAAANEVIGVSNDMHETMSQAEVVVYWAITDLCPDQVGQRQDHWRDGQHANTSTATLTRNAEVIHGHDRASPSRRCAFIGPHCDRGIGLLMYRSVPHIETQ
jgi:hypothetical protein